MSIQSKTVILFLPLLALAAGGCKRSAPNSVDVPTPSPVAHATGSSQAEGAAEEHAHEAGAHGGIVVSLGRDNYHAEAVFEDGGVLRLFTLGRDESQVQEVDAQTLKAFVNVRGGGAARSILLKPEPQDGDTAGTTSQFVGQLPADLQGQALAVTIPNLRIGGERFRLGFESVAQPHSENAMAHGEAAVPPKVADDKERQLYLTPGGVYSQADIAANGAVTGSEKFKDFVSSHDLKPKTGDKICPVTLTKSNPKCSWVVGGKTYEFCCPPCVDEFVKLAKQHPEEVKEPEDYVKK